MKPKKENLIFLILNGLLSLFYFASTALQLFRWQQNEGTTENPTIQLAFSFIYGIFHVSAFSILLFPSQEKQIKKYLSFVFMSYMLFIPFTVAVSTVLSFLLYGLATTGIVLFHKYR